MAFDHARRRLERFYAEVLGCRVPVKDGAWYESKFIDISASGDGDGACFVKCPCGSGRVRKVGERDDRVIGESL